jgi:hypothetical protein
MPMQPPAALAFDPASPAFQKYLQFHQASVRMNDLAGRIHSEADARQLIDMVAEEFAEMLPPMWATEMVRDRVATAEYESATDPTRLLPEQRIVDVWNRYVREIGGPEEALVTAVEIHNLRGASYAIGRISWRGNVSSQNVQTMPEVYAARRQNFWTMPNIYAVGSDGKIADGCRALETLLIIHDLDMEFDNIRYSRERVKNGIAVSDLLKQKPEKRATAQGAGSVRFTMNENPVRDAELRYFREQGEIHYGLLLESTFNELFPN